MRGTLMEFFRKLAEWLGFRRVYVVNPALDPAFVHAYRAELERRSSQS